MESLQTTPGFFGPNLLADFNLVIQILFYLILCAGVVAQLQQKYKWHDRLQTPVIILNLFFIFFVMVPTFASITGTLPSGFSEVPNTVAFIHGSLGLIAQGLAIYCLLAGFKILPRKVGVLRYWMWATFAAWTATIIFGIGVYIFFYTVTFATPPSPDITTEHNADVIQPEQLPTEESTEPEPSDPEAEHAEDVVEPEPTAVPTKPALAPTKEPPTPTEPAPVPTPTEELVSEHNGG